MPWNSLLSYSVYYAKACWKVLIHIHACTHIHTNIYKHRKAHKYKIFVSVFDLKTICLFLFSKQKPLTFFFSHSQFSIHKSDVSETNLWNLSLRSSSNPAVKFNGDFSSSFLLWLMQLTYTLNPFLVSDIHFDDFYIMSLLIPESDFPVLSPDLQIIKFLDN